MLVKFLNSGDKVSTNIAGSYFKGDGWTGAYYNHETGQLVFESEDGLGFVTEDLRIAIGGTYSVEWTNVLNKPTSFTPSAHTHTWTEVQNKPVSFPPDVHAHTWADITDKPTEFTPVSHNHTISEVTDLQSTIDNKADKSQILTQQQFRDSVAAMFQSGTHTNVSINYDPVVGTLNLSATGGGGASVSEEEVQDWVGNLITHGTGISVIYDDVGNVLSIGLSGVSFTSADKAKLDGIANNATANSTDSQLRDRSTHTGTQAISTISGLQTALDGKQPTTSFKTINGTVITGTGDIVVSAGPHNHGISDVTGLQAALNSSNVQLSAVATFATPIAGGIVPGRYYDNATSGTNNNNYTGNRDRADMALFVTSRTLTVDQIGFAVVTAGSGAYGRAFIYGCGADGWPSNLLYESGDLDLNTSNSFSGETLASPFTFDANRVYWVGWRFNEATSHAVMRSINSSNTPSLGLTSNSGVNYCTVLRRSVPFLSPMPATWVFNESELFTSNAPSFRMRAK